MPEKRIVPERGVVEVTFTMPAEVGAGRVELVGDFTNWNAVDLEQQGDGSWACTLELPPGRSYQYRYRIDESRWDNDWQADGYVDNQHGQDNSVIHTPSLDANTLEATSASADRAPSAGGSSRKSGGGKTPAKGATKKGAGNATSPGKAATKQAAPAKKASAQKAAGKSAPAQKAPAQKAAAKKAPASKAPAASKAAAKQTPAKKAPATKAAAQKTSAEPTPSQPPMTKAAATKPAATRKVETKKAGKDQQE